MMRLWAVLQHISFPKVVAAFRYRSVLSTYSNIFWKRFHRLDVTSGRLITKFVQLRRFVRGI